MRFEIPTSVDTSRANFFRFILLRILTLLASPRQKSFPSFRCAEAIWRCPRRSPQNQFMFSPPKNYESQGLGLSPIGCEIFTRDAMGDSSENGIVDGRSDSKPWLPAAPGRRPERRGREREGHRPRPATEQGKLSAVASEEICALRFQPQSTLPGQTFFVSFSSEF